MIYVISDCHFSHKNIIEYCKRPFTDIEEMNTRIILNWNRVVSERDMVYHLGDFTLHKDPEEFEEQLNGRIIHLRGNHDKIKYQNIAILEYMGKTIYMTHYRPKTLYNIPDSVDIILCGHEHNNFKFDTLFRNGTPIPIINISVENINYTPVSLEYIVKNVKTPNT